MLNGIPTNNHVRRIAVKNDNVWLPVNIALVENTAVKPADNVKEYRPLHHGRVIYRVCGAGNALFVLDPFFLKTSPFQDDQRRYRFAGGGNLGDDGDMVSAI